MLTHPTFPTTTPTEEECKLASESSRCLAEVVAPGEPIRLTLTDHESGPVVLPAPAAQLLVYLLEQLAAGNAVTLIPIHAELTTQQAADLLGVSRPFVVKEISEGRLPARKVGTHRRVLFEHLAEYKRRMDVERQSALDRLAELDQELGLD